MRGRHLGAAEGCAEIRQSRLWHKGVEVLHTLGASHDWLVFDFSAIMLQADSVLKIRRWAMHLAYVDCIKGDNVMSTCRCTNCAASAKAAQSL